MTGRIGYHGIPEYPGQLSTSAYIYAWAHRIVHIGQQSPPRTYLILRIQSHHTFSNILMQAGLQAAPREQPCRAITEPVPERSMSPVPERSQSWAIIEVPRALFDLSEPVPERSMSWFIRQMRAGPCELE